jgi:hypothetical protein
MKMKVWVVEIYNEVKERFEPTVGVRLTRSDARIEMQDWMKRNPEDAFRIQPYARLNAASNQPVTGK